MRRISRWSLLLAPVILAMTVGCASPPRWTTKSTSAPESGADRIARMLTAADQCEKEGKQELARKMYEHVLVQQPDNKVARARLEELTRKSSGMNGSYYAHSVPRRSGSAEERLAEMQARMKRHSQAQGQDPSLLAKTPSPPTPPAADSLIEGISDAEAFAAPRDLDRPSVAENFPVPNPEPSPAAVAEVDSAVPETSTIDDIPAWARQDEVAEPNIAATTVLPEIRPAYSGRTDALPSTDVWRTTEAPTAPESSDVAATDEPLIADAAPATDEAPVESVPAIDEASLNTAPSIAAETSAGWKTSEIPGRTNDGWNTTGEAPVEPVRTATLAELCAKLPDDFSEIAPLLLSESADDRITGLNELASVGAYAAPTTLVVLALIEHADPRTSVHAAATLHAINGDAWTSVRTLAAHLSSNDLEIVRLAAYLLGQLGSEALDAQESLAVLRDGSETMTRLYAAEALLRIVQNDEPSMTVLKEAVRHHDTQVRWFAAVSLGMVPETHVVAAVESLKESLRDADAEVRAAAALSLGGLGEHGRTAVGDLERAVQLDTAEVRDAATLALACLNVESR